MKFSEIFLDVINAKHKISLDFFFKSGDLWKTEPYWHLKLKVSININFLSRYLRISELHTQIVSILILLSPLLQRHFSLFTSSQVHSSVRHKKQLRFINRAEKWDDSSYDVANNKSDYIFHFSPLLHESSVSTMKDFLLF